MKRLFLFLLLIFISQIAICQYAKSVGNTNGTGWRRIAYVDSNNKRGFGKVSIYTEGGTARPVYTDIYWYSDWSNQYNLKVENLIDDASYWETFRITEDANKAYLEVNFKTPIDNLTVLVDDYGYYMAKPYAGVFPNGGGTVCTEIRNARFNIANQLLMNEIGNVGIGTNGLTTAKLAVNGLIRGKEIKVETSNFWPDYVFKPEYQLQSLAQTEQYIQENGHLPEIPKASEIESDGIPLGKMNALLLKKIEELTLHLIEKDKEITEINKVLKSLVQQKNQDK
jgi:hypothetical protein